MKNYIEFHGKVISKSGVWIDKVKTGYTFCKVKKQCKFLWIKYDSWNWDWKENGEYFVEFGNGDKKWSLKYNYIQEADYERFIFIKMLKEEEK